MFQNNPNREKQVILLMISDGEKREANPGNIYGNILQSKTIIIIKRNSTKRSFFLLPELSPFL